MIRTSKYVCPPGMHKASSSSRPTKCFCYLGDSFYGMAGCCKLVASLWVAQKWKQASKADGEEKEQGGVSFVAKGKFG